MLRFYPLNHKYESIVPDDIKWLSVSSIVSMFKLPFDRQGIAEKCSTKRSTDKYPNKWNGIAPEKILAIWDKEALRSTELGTWYHNKREQELYQSQATVYRPIYDGDIKIASEQKLQEGIYPEHLCYLESAGICGQSDKVMINGGYIHVTDYKSNKEIKRKGFTNWEGVTSKLLPPLSHLDQCEFNLYAIQLSTYTYIIHKHNPKLRVGNLTIEHVTFVEDHLDEHGYPVYKLDDNNEPIIKQVESISVPYMKSEVEAIIKHIKSKR